MPKKTPVMSIGSEEIEHTPPIKKGQFVMCPRCKTKHVVQYGTSKGIESSMLAFYTCKKNSYLCGLAGKAMPGVELAP